MQSLGQEDMLVAMVEIWLAEGWSRAEEIRDCVSALTISFLE